MLTEKSDYSGMDERRSGLRYRGTLNNEIPFLPKEVMNMEKIVANEKVMAEGQITLPKEILEAMNLTTGDSVTLICDNNRVVMMNSTVYAMKLLQEGIADVSDLPNEDEVTELVHDVRSEVEGL